MVAWHDVSSARAQWADAPKGNGQELEDLLDAAKDAVWRYVYPEWADLKDDGTPNPIPDDVPTRFRIAQLLQVRAVWGLPRTGGGDSVGIQDYAARVYVLGYDIQKVLVPPSRLPVIG